MKKIDELSLAKTLEFAGTCYGEKISAGGIELLKHCRFVARQAETIAVKLFNDLRQDYFQENTKDMVTAIVHCAVLHEVLNVSSCAFENIAESANVQIAAMVAAISRDFRLVETKRDMEFRGRLSQSSVGSQIVVVANIICTAKELLKLLDLNGAAAAPKAKKIIGQLDGDLLAIHAANKYYTLRLFCHAAKNLITEVSQQIKIRRHRARAEKAHAQLVQRLAAEKTAQSTQTSQTSSSKPPKKKREVRYARKRNVRPDM